MNMPDGLLPAALILWTHIAFWPLLVWAVLTAPWVRLRSAHRQHVFLAATIGLMSLWIFSVGVTPGLEFHYLGVTAVTLMFGARLAIVLVAAGLAVITLLGHSGFEAYAFNAVLMGVVPAALTYGVYRVVDRYLPNHFFIYVYLNGFLAGGLAMATVGYTLTGLLQWVGIYEPGLIAYEYRVYLPLMAFSEAFLNGLLVTALVAVKPEWILTFDDERYIKGK